MSRNTLLISPKTVKERSAVHLNVDDQLIVPEIKTAQDIEIVEAIGSSLMARLQAGAEAGTGADGLTNAEKTLINEYIADALVYYTMAYMAVSTSFQFFTKGLLRQQNANSDLPSVQDMQGLAGHYTQKGKFYRERLIKYLKKNAASFPLYKECGDQDITPIDSSYNFQCYIPE